MKAASTKNIIVEREVINSPKLSVNKLAEYITANATRRKAILKTAKFPDAFKHARYRQARDAAKMFLVSGKKDHVRQAINILKVTGSYSEWQISNRKNSIEALEEIMKSDLSFLKGSSLSAVASGQPKLFIKRLEISVTPDVIIKKQIKGVELIGALKLSMVKGGLSDEGQSIVALVTYMFVKEFLAEDHETVNEKLCFSFDVFKQHSECCPKSFKRRIADIEIACEEIVSRWDDISL